MILKEGGEGGGNLIVFHKAQSSLVAEVNERHYEDPNMQAIKDEVLKK